MNRRANQQAVEAPIGWAFAHLLDQAKRAWATIADTLIVSARGWGAAILYEELAKLSDAELERRGTSRADLPRYVLERFDKR